MKKRVLIVGAGISGAVLARKLAETASANITIIDERSHVAGNCHTSRDLSTGVMVHQYGPHIFNTNHQDVWEFVNKHCEMVPYINRVKAVANGTIYSFPINLHTINQLFGCHFTPDQARGHLKRVAIKNPAPKNFEEQALSLVGEKIYQTFFYGYTKKQWGCEPSSLPASILKRIPIRFNYDDNYYSSRYQGIPREGYTAMVDRMLDHKSIKLHLGETYAMAGGKWDLIFYSGAIDRFFHYEFGRLSYRTVHFKWSRREGDAQGNAVINYPGLDKKYTRVHEHKCFAPWENHDKTILAHEYSRETGARDVPFYPKRLADDLARLASYKKRAESLDRVTFLGRLGTYRYLDMDVVIGESLDLAERVIKSNGMLSALPRFTETRTK